MRIQRVLSKWAKTETLLKDPAVAEYVPVTSHFNRLTVKELLDRFEMIYVKPVQGTFGKGVIRLEKRTEGAAPYFFQSGEKKYEFLSFDEMYDRLVAVKRKRSYLAQQGIPLLKHKGRRFDLRSMVQKNPANRWETTGLIGRLGHPRKIVTNYHSGGTPLPIERLLATHVPDHVLPSYLNGIRKLSVQVAASLEKRYPRIKEIGIDFAIDEQLKPWILEVNTLPDPYIFKKLPSRSVFKRIYSYCVAYGRFRRKRR
ncbi:YheC/YheD family protein [Cohnella faecalis]|uniref:YheC/YheD family protein n=1 Tax=Cohnella faecalis TaxID=2315694 RepID=A0A398CG38_9BACL|nr:YheC/YheD family protein [Cohnella faecalis]RIE01425.1 YheC/YheD family protein [Cohnella faecalis]